MIRAYVFENGRLVEVPEGGADLDRAVWVDLLRPGEEEREAVERALGIRLPSREAMQEIETSSRLHRVDGGLVMTAPLLARAESAEPVSDPVTFLLHRGRLVTLRWIEPRAFEMFRSRAQQEPLSPATAEGVFAGLLDAVVDRLADTLEFAKREIHRISQSVFRAPVPDGGRDDGLRHVLAAIGRHGELISDIRESITGLQRLVLFWQGTAGRSGLAPEPAAVTDTLRRDLASLADHAAFLAHDVNVLLDATLGFVDIEQNHIIKIFTVLAVLFLPPTLVASIYGMNFHHMPELEWPFGYPPALLLMVLSASLPWRWFRRRGWLRGRSDGRRSCCRPGVAPRSGHARGRSPRPPAGLCPATAAAGLRGGCTGAAGPEVAAGSPRTIVYPLFPNGCAKMVNRSLKVSAPSRRPRHAPRRSPPSVPSPRSRGRRSGRRGAGAVRGRADPRPFRGGFRHPVGGDAASGAPLLHAGAARVR